MDRSDEPHVVIDAATAPESPSSSSAGDASRASLETGAGDTAAEINMNPPTDAAGSCGTCAAYGAAVLTGNIQAANLNAISGIAESWRNPGVIYVHNDRNSTDFFAVAENGALLGQFSLPGAVVQDFEDIAVARCPVGTCVYLADIGDNSSQRADGSIFRVAEPEVNPARPSAMMQVAFERFVFTYPDGAHNAESLLIDSASGSLYVITKVAAGAKSAVYRLPALDAARPVVAVKVTELPVPATSDQPATSGSAHPCSPAFLLRTGNTLYEFRAAAGAPFEDAFRATPSIVPVGVELQGEGVSYRADGRGYYTTSERAMPPIHRVGCR